MFKVFLLFFIAYHQPSISMPRAPPNAIPCYAPLSHMPIPSLTYQIPLYYFFGAQLVNHPLALSKFPDSASSAATHHSKSYAPSPANISANFRRFWLPSSVQKYISAPRFHIESTKGFTNGIASLELATPVLRFSRVCAVLQYSLAHQGFPQPVMS